MNLIFFPSNFKLELIRDAVELALDKLDENEQTFKLFDYNDKDVVEQEYIDIHRSIGKNLIVPLEFIKDYCNNNPDQEFYIYLFTDGFSDEYKELNISDYMPENVSNIFYVVIPYDYLNNRADFQEMWLIDERFKYIEGAI